MRAINMMPIYPKGIIWFLPDRKNKEQFLVIRRQIAESSKQILNFYSVLPEKTKPETRNQIDFGFRFFCNLQSAICNLQSKI